MEKKPLILRWLGIISLLALLILSAADLSAQTRKAPTLVTNYTIKVIKGQVQVKRARSDAWDPAYTNQVLFVDDRVRVGPKSQLTIQSADQSSYRLDEKSEFQVVPPKTPSQPSTSMRLLGGVLYFFHRGKPRPFDVETPTASAAIRGTEFNLQYDDASSTTIISVIDGTVDLGNAVGAVPVLSGQQGVAQPGQVPEIRPRIDAINNIIQWSLYYPGILDANEIPLTDPERGVLASSLLAYRSGDLVRAVGEYPAGREPQSEAERIYLAGILLSVGQADDAQQLLGPLAVAGAAGQVSTNTRLAGALQQVIATVKLQPTEPKSPPELASEWLAESYRLQSLANLEGALSAARKSVEKSPEFGFGWARVAELEFSFGRTDAATEPVAKALQHSPRNAQAVALNGFLFAARNKIDSAIQEFNKAIEIDGGLANAWLGRGLCLIRKGQPDAGREDLLTAAAVEPQRAFLRSYLAKAWTDNGEKQLAEHELELAKQFDPRDPTAWLYSALLKQQYNRINEAIRDIEHTQELNTNRTIYRSQFHLDQDLAVRSANLARIYRDAGMFEVSIREAGRAVATDYSSYSAHLFLAESYMQLRDPQLMIHRYETPATAEYLTANLLAPVGAGILSPTISQGEYSKLFERNRLGLVSATEYLSRGAWEQSAAQFGTFGNFSYSVDGYYRTDPGEGPNSDLESEGLTLHLKQQLTDADMLYFSAGIREREGGDPFQRYDPSAANPSVRYKESQEPFIIAGYHRTWSPESHTLVSFIRTDHHLTVSDSISPSLFVRRPEGPIFSVHDLAFQREYENQININSVEAQQIWSRGNHQVIGGIRFQDGDIDARETLANPTDFHIYFPDPGTTILEQASSYDFERFTVYAYETWQLHESLSLTLGLSYDTISYPENTAYAPLTSDANDKSQLSPKAGLIWTPHANTTVRAAYSQTITGIGLDQSLQIEPTQLAGFNQTFRTIAPAAFYGTTPGERFEMFGLSVEQKFSHGTYLGIEAGRLTSTGSRVRGSFETPPPEDPFGFALPSGIHENIEFEENSATVTLNQLVGDEWAFGLSYRLADAQHDRLFPDAPVLLDDPFPGGPIQAGARIESVLHTVTAYSLFNHRSGLFAGVNAAWYKQDIDGYDSPLENDSFWHFDLVAGYRFWRRKAEITVGLLNITDQDYRLLPLNFYLELPRERTLLLRLRWNL